MKRGETLQRSAAEGAFSLPELLVALALALLLATLVIQGMVGASRGGERLALLLRERQFARRTLGLVRSELELARSWQTGVAAGAGAECSLGGRTPVLGLARDGRQITYSVGTAPSRIWRGRVLMRCGPAYGLEGELSPGVAQNRVLLDSLDPMGLELRQDAPGVVRIQLRQTFETRLGDEPKITTSMLGSEPTADAVP